ncbi:hypothetical protein [Ferrimicrobium sp.]|uniref:hypothetical protein n=1 Tax=Ferrimicrobium sp. TaxID=2926050 RepID=UPI0026371094|nr:hypothetical protein [Ferrimicrobium sp.]
MIGAGDPDQTKVRMGGVEILGAKLAGRVTAYRIASRAYFHLPIVFPFLYLHHFTLLSIAGLLALYGLVIAIGRFLLLPLNRRLSVGGHLVTGEVLKIVGLLLLLAPLSTLDVATSQVLSGLGFCMTAGTDTALASRLRHGEEYRRSEARTQMGMFLVSFTAGVVGALLFTVADRSPFVLSMFSCAGSALIMATSGVPLVSDRSAASTAASSKLVRVGSLPRDRRVVFWSWYYSVNRAVLLSTYTYLLPLLLFVHLRLRVAAFGAVLGLYTLFGLVASWLSLRLTATGHSLKAFLATSAAAVVALGLLSAGSFASTIPAIALLGLAGGLIRPVTMMYLGPAMAGLSTQSRQHTISSLERNQGLIQAVSLVAAALVMCYSHSISGSFLAAMAGMLLYQVAAGFFVSSRATDANAGIL